MTNLSRQWEIEMCAALESQGQRLHRKSIDLLIAWLKRISCFVHRTQKKVKIQNFVIVQQRKLQFLQISKLQILRLESFIFIKKLCNLFLIDFSYSMIEFYIIFMECVAYFSIDVLLINDILSFIIIIWH